MDTEKLYAAISKLEVHTNDSFERSSTVLVILPGIADSRIQDACWQNYSDTVWVTGTRNDPPYTQARIEKLLAHNGQLPSSLLCQGYAEHTPEQMKWVTKNLLEQKNISTLVLSTARYHLPRCTLTFIKEWNRNGDSRPLKIGTLSTRDPNEEESQTFIGTSHSKVQELARIREYQQKGDIATAEEFLRFMRH